MMFFVFMFYMNEQFFVEIKSLTTLNKRPSVYNGHLGIRDSTLTYCHIFAYQNDHHDRVFKINIGREMMHIIT